MKTIVCMLLSFLAFTTLGFAAPTLITSYVEGSAYLRNGSSWQELSIGDSVPTETSVRLDAGASVQLKGIGTDIYLTQKGTYAMKDILAARQKIGSVGVDSVLAASIAYLLTGPAHKTWGSSGSSGISGARGANASQGADSDWVITTSAQDNIQQAQDYIKAGEFDKAIEKLTQKLDEATAEELSEVHFYLAYAYSLSGDLPNAARQIAGAKPNSGDSWAGDYVLLQAKLYLDTFAFTYAIQWLTQPGNDLSGDAQRAPLYYCLLGLGYWGVSDAKNATRSLSKVVSLAGDSDLGKETTQLLQGP